MRSFTVGPLKKKTFTVEVPASKSILNRAILLSAFTEGDTSLYCGEYGDDTEFLLGCLASLGIAAEKMDYGLLIHGTKNFKRNATLNVGNAGTAARFLTAVLAFLGGTYEFHASPQMAARPMEILPLLSSLGVVIEPLSKESSFPFRMRSQGISAGKASVDTDISTQYASGIMLGAALGGSRFELTLLGSRTDGSYLKMTSSLIQSFGGKCEPLTAKVGYLVGPVSPLSEYTVEADVSGACYFYALSLLCNAVVTVRGIHFSTLQGDFGFLKLLRAKGVRLTDTEVGIVADGSHVPFYNGIDEEMTDFSDQTMTVAVLAAFAESPSILRGISHIRSQECDRVEAILENLNAMGTRAFTNGEDIFIEPAPVHPCKIKSFGDHRVAMAFALSGMKIGNMEIDDPVCCKKTFPHFFDLVTALME